MEKKKKNNKIDITDMMALFMAGLDFWFTFTYLDSIETPVEFSGFFFVGCMYLMLPLIARDVTKGELKHKAKLAIDTIMEAQR